MAIRKKALSFLLFPSLAVLWKFSSPFVKEFLPLYMQVAHVHPGSGNINTTTQYPIIDFVSANIHVLLLYNIKL